MKYTVQNRTQPQKREIDKSIKPKRKYKKQTRKKIKRSEPIRKIIPTKLSEIRKTLKYTKKGAIKNREGYKNMVKEG